MKFVSLTDEERISVQKRYKKQYQPRGKDAM